MNNINSYQWLARLISFDTTSRNSNLEMIEDIRDYLLTQGLKPELIYSPNNHTKANLFATIPCLHGKTSGGIIFSGHTDVVPVDGQNWNSDPFSMIEKTGKLYGRGSADMKGFIAVVLSLVPHFLSLKLRKPIHLALSYDEEVGCLGAHVMLKSLKQRGFLADGCVVGEPTSMRIVVAHKGINVYLCRVHGKSAHSSITPSGCNAIEYAAQLICKIREVANQFKSQGPYDNFFDVPFSTITTNQISGGIAINTIPDLCEFVFELRNLPGMDVSIIQLKIEEYINCELLPKMVQEYANASINLELIAKVPSLEASEQAIVSKLARELSRDKAIHKVAYASEGGCFQNAGYPSIICGPGNIEQAHKANEFIEIEQLQLCESFLLKMAHSLVW